MDANYHVLNNSVIIKGTSASLRTICTPKGVQTMLLMFGAVAILNKESCTFAVCTSVNPNFPIGYVIRSEDIKSN